MVLLVQLSLSHRNNGYKSRQQVKQHVECWGNNFFLKSKFLTLEQRHFPGFSRKENSKSSQIQMFPDVSRIFQKIWKNMEFSRLFQSVTNPGKYHTRSLPSESWLVFTAPSTNNAACEFQNFDVCSKAALAELSFGGKFCPTPALPPKQSRRNLARRNLITGYYLANYSSSKV